MITLPVFNLLLPERLAALSVSQNQVFAKHLFDCVLLTYREVHVIHPTTPRASSITLSTRPRISTPVPGILRVSRQQAPLSPSSARRTLRETNATMQVIGMISPQVTVDSDKELKPGKLGQRRRWQRFRTRLRDASWMNLASMKLLIRGIQRKYVLRDTRRIGRLCESRLVDRA